MQKRDTLILLGLGAVVFLSRLPFIPYGYGNDADAWSVAAAAESIARTGEYRFSRPPGHPVQEIVCAAIWNTGPVGLNGATALFSGLASVFFALCLRSLGRRAFWAGGLALAFTPVVWIHSTGLLDHVWALAFIAASLYCVLSRRPIPAGALLGLAAGCRATSILLVVPFSLYLFLRNRRIATAAGFAGVAVILGLTLYIPAYRAHGDYMFTVWEHGYPKLHTILFMSGIQVWGIPGVVAVPAALGIGVWTQWRSPAPLSDRSRALVWLSSTAILLFGVLFLRLPHEAGYLVPAVPFVILLLHVLVDRRTFVGVCLLVALSSLFLGLRQNERVAGHQVDSGLAGTFTIRNVELVLDLAYGPVIYDRILRKAWIGLTSKVADLARNETGKVVFITAGVSPHFGAIDLPDRANVVFTRLLDGERGRDYVKGGFDIYYLKDIAPRYNRAVTGFDLEAAGAMHIGQYPPLTRAGLPNG